MRIWWCSFLLLMGCSVPSAEVTSDPPAQEDSVSRSGAWFDHEQDNSKFIERYNAMRDSAGAPKDTTVIYTDTWTAPGTFAIVEDSTTDQPGPSENGSP